MQRLLVPCPPRGPPLQPHICITHRAGEEGEREGRRGGGEREGGGGGGERGGVEEWWRRRVRGEEPDVSVREYLH